MKNKKSKLLDKSLAWIRTHLHATNLDVPGEFLAQWIFEDDEAEAKPNGFFLSVFTFGYMQHELLCGCLPPTQPRSVSIDHLIERFGRWQLKLALTEIHRRTDIQVEPMPLFGFSDGEEVRFRPRSSDAKPASTG